MKKFVAVSPYGKIPEGLYPIDCAPGPKYEVYLFSKTENVSFDEVVYIILHSFNKTNLLGAASLVYFKYYNEFYEYILNLSTKQKLSKKQKWAVKRFYKRYLIKWIEFIKYSDDTMYPQNEVFRMLSKLIEERFL